MRFAFVAILVVGVSCTSTAPAAPSVAGSAESAASPEASAPTPTPKPAPVIGWTYEGTLRENAVDARSVILPDGGYRQVFSRFRSFEPGPQGNGVDPYYVIATSKDGLHWTDEGESSISYFIPVRLPDGTYRALALKRNSLYTSTDAKTWTLVGRLVGPEIGNPQCGGTSGMFSDVIALPDGTLRAYYNCVVGNYFNIPTTEIKSAISKDGLVWQKDAGVRINPLDGKEVPRGVDGQVNGAGAAEHPRVVTLPDGTLKMFYHSLDGLWSATSVDGLTWTNRQFERVRGGDADAIVLPDGRLRVFLNGTLGLPQEFAGKTPGENTSRMVSYVYGSTAYRLRVAALGTDCCAVGVPAHVAVTVEGSGPPVTLDAFRYEHAAAFDLVNGPDSSVKVVFSPASGSPPFTADAAITFGVRGAEQGPILAAGIAIAGDDGNTTVVTTLEWSRGGGGGGGGAAGPMPACQLGADVPVGGCYVPGSTGPDGSPLGCVPLAARDIAAQPPVCRPYLVPVH